MMTEIDYVRSAGLFYLALNAVILIWIGAHYGRQWIRQRRNGR